VHRLNGAARQHAAVAGAAQVDAKRRVL
jgi:hypothetical protein